MTRLASRPAVARASTHVPAHVGDLKTVHVTAAIHRPPMQGPGPGGGHVPSTLIRQLAAACVCPGPPSLAGEKGGAPVRVPGPSLQGLQGPSPWAGRPDLVSAGCVRAASRGPRLPSASQPRTPLTNCCPCRGLLTCCPAQQGVAKLYLSFEEIKQQPRACLQQLAKQLGLAGRFNCGAMHAALASLPVPERWMDPGACVAVYV